MPHKVKTGWMLCGSGSLDLLSSYPNLGDMHFCVQPLTPSSCFVLIFMNSSKECDHMGEGPLLLMDRQSTRTRKKSIKPDLSV
jgi:hypothetical protein